MYIYISIRSSPLPPLSPPYLRFCYSKLKKSRTRCTTRACCSAAHRLYKQISPRCPSMVHSASILSATTHTHIILPMAPHGHRMADQPSRQYDIPCHAMPYLNRPNTPKYGPFSAPSSPIISGPLSSICCTCPPSPIISDGLKLHKKDPWRTMCVEYAGARTIRSLSLAIRRTYISKRQRFFSLPRGYRFSTEWRCKQVSASNV